MPRIEWNKDYSVGFRDIDVQHQNWIDIHNDLHELLISGNSNDVRGATMSTLKAMRDYAVKHFSFEEEYMQTIGYPDKERHAQIHRAFEGMVENYVDDIKNGDVVLNTDIMKILRSWLVNHILNEDKKYGEFAAAN
nr:hemerythrin family protein [Desulfobulbaceae bacterium]